MSIKESRGIYMGGFRVRKERGEMLQLKNTVSGHYGVECTEKQPSSCWREPVEEYVYINIEQAQKQSDKMQGQHLFQCLSLAISFFQVSSSHYTFHSFLK